MPVRNAALRHDADAMALDEIEVTGEPERLYSNFICGITALPVRLGAA